MQPITRGSIPKALWPGVNAFFGNQYMDHKPEWPELFESFNSNKAFEEDVGIMQMGYAPEKQENAPIEYDYILQGFTKRYVNVTYALGFQLTEECIEDNLYPRIGARNARALARSMRHTQEAKAASIFNFGFNTAAQYAGADGQPLFSTAHPFMGSGGGTYSNQLNPSADISEAALETIHIAISNWTDDRGLKINIMPKKIAIPPDLQPETERILNSIQRVGTANNDLNALKTMGWFPGGYVVNHWFTDTDAYFVLTDCPEGLKHMRRIRLTFMMDNDFETGNAKYKARQRYAYGFTDPHCAYGSAGI